MAEIDAENCLGCGSCVAVCRYDAVIPDEQNKEIFAIDPIACDGCAACVYACQQNAISMIPQQEGHWFRSNSPYGTLFHAELFPGKENSGKLVTLIKQQAKLWAEDNLSKIVIVDGPPGIGCPVISACAGADLGFIVTEPSLSGLHDLKRVLETLNHFRVPTVICINKADLYLEGTRQIKEFAALKALKCLEKFLLMSILLMQCCKVPPLHRFFQNRQLLKPLTKYGKIYTLSSWFIRNHHDESTRNPRSDPTKTDQGH